VEYIVWCLAGTLYGMIIGILPMSGATVGLLTVFGLSHYFVADPYLGIVFLVSLVAASSTGDSFTSILTGIPGSNTTAASIIDGHQMAKQGQAARAIGIAMLDSTINGVLWGSLAFFLLPYYAKIILFFGIPEFAALMILALACVGFITSKNTVLGIFAIAIGIVLGLVGLNPGTGVERFTFGWDYLAAGIQLIPVIAGLFGVPEIVAGFSQRGTRPQPVVNYWSQMKQGFSDCLLYKRDMLRGGFIGFITGILPGIGGTIGDIMAYGSTVARNPSEKFGNGNPRGLAGCEGANNAQKASSLIPTVLFGIPGAPFAAVMMAICMYFGIELGTPALLNDTTFIYSMAVAFLVSTILAFFIAIFTTRLVVRILEIPYWIYALVISVILLWSSTQYTGTMNDIYILVLCSMLGLVCKFTGISRPAIMVAFILAPRLENYSQQALTLYTVTDLLQRPLFLSLIIAAIALFVYSLMSKNSRITYT